MKTVFLSYMPMTATLEGMVPIAFLQSHDREVEFWDLRRIFYPDLKIEGTIERPYIRHFESRRQFEQQVARDHGAFFILHFNASPDRLWVFEALSRHKARTGYLSWGQLPSFNAQLWPRLRRTVFSKPWETLRNQITKFKIAESKVAHFDATFYAGSAGKDAAPNSDAYVASNLPDYDRYIRTTRDETRSCFASRQPFAVFLDCFLPFHPDFEIIEVDTLDPEKYRRSMVRLFERVERLIGGKVLIAAHPKANYPAGYFGSREIIAGRTAELVINSTLVVSHYSTSTSLAVMAGKPLVFAYTREMDSKRCGYSADYVRAFAIELGSPCVDADAEANDLLLVDVDEERYRRYRYRYITTPDAEGRSNGDIFLSFLSRLDVQ